MEKEYYLLKIKELEIRLKKSEDLNNRSAIELLRIRGNLDFKRKFYTAVSDIINSIAEYNINFGLTK